MSRQEDLRRIAELMKLMNREQLLVVKALLLVRATRKWVAVHGAALVDRVARAIVIGEDDNAHKKLR